MDELRRREPHHVPRCFRCLRKLDPVELPIVTADDGHRPPDVFLSHGEREGGGGNNDIVCHLASIVVPAVINTCDVVTDHFGERYFSC